MQKFNLLDVINGKIILTEERKQGLYNLISKGAHTRTKEIIHKRIFNDHLSMFPHCGILGRVMFDVYNDLEIWSYCAGQSYPDEMRTVRSIFVNMR